MNVMYDQRPADTSAREFHFLYMFAKLRSTWGWTSGTDVAIAGVSSKEDSATQRKAFLQRVSRPNTDPSRAVCLLCVLRERSALIGAGILPALHSP